MWPLFPVRHEYKDGLSLNKMQNSFVFFFVLFCYRQMQFANVVCCSMNVVCFDGQFITTPNLRRPRSFWNYTGWTFYSYISIDRLGNVLLNFYIRLYRVRVFIQTCRREQYSLKHIGNFSRLLKVQAQHRSKLERFRSGTVFQNTKNWKRYSFSSAADVSNMLMF